MKTFPEFLAQYPNGKVPDQEIDKHRELDGYPLTDERLNEIEAYELYVIQESKLGERLNGRLVLSMIRELRALREVVKVSRQALAQLDETELRSRNPHEERWRK